MDDDRNPVGDQPSGDSRLASKIREIAGRFHNFQASVQTGSSKLVAGTKSIATANITAQSVIVPISNAAVADAATVGVLSISAPVVGQPGSFSIDSTNGADVQNVEWLVIG